MEKFLYSYHFSLHLNFKDDVNVDDLEKHFGIKAYKKTFLKDSKGKDKTAKLWYKSKDFTDINTDESVELFVKKIYNNFKDLRDILKDNNGLANFTIYFTETHERPIIALTPTTIELFYKLGLSFEVDFCQ